MKIDRIVLHQLYLSAQREVISAHTHFKIEDYSRFKYGDTRIAQQYGVALAKKASEYHQQLPQATTQIALTSSAFRYTPTAAQSITNAFFQHLQVYDSIDIEYFKIHRTFLDGRDYAQLAPEERNQVLQKANLTLDDSQNLYGKTVWVIDDIRITGKHEEKVLHFLREQGAKKVVFLYVAVLAQGPELSWVEHYLNHAWVKNIERFAQIAQQPYFQINARVCKFILSYPCSDALQAFFESLSDTQLRLFYKAAKEDDFDKISTYHRAFRQLESHYRLCHKTERLMY